MSHVRAAAAGLCLRYGTRCPYELADHLGIEIIEFSFKKLKGLSLAFKNQKIIAVNSNLQHHEKKFIIFHEIGHLELHIPFIGHYFIKEKTYFVSGKLEREADLFAATILLDELPMESETVQEHSARTGVPAKLIKVGLF